ncbi:MAG: amidohydrolase [Oscillospiraceae bacterium]|jgi:5-methylthioadenosine/S-adenosylhomocysteine deaminase|nr:amidohydrolase [Oscillospiraceae bacterium]
MDTLFSNTTVVTMDEDMRVLFSAFVGVTDGKISYLSRKAPEEQPAQIINGEGMVLMPGLINCHTHLPMAVLRGYADDCKLSQWLGEYIFPREERFDGRCVKAATLLSIAEALRFGTTSVSDMYDFCDEIAQAVAQSGIKANLSRGVTLFGEDFDPETHKGCREMFALKEKWHNYDRGRILVDASIHGEYTSDHRLWDTVSEFAINEKLGMHVHLSETEDEHTGCLDRHGLTPAQVLDCHKVFAVRAQAAHCVWLEPEDMALLAKRKVSAVHCPVSNLKLASGCAKVTDMVRAGMNVALGTDSSASNNNLDLFEEIKAATLMAKAVSRDPAALPAQAALMMATVCGARAQGREAQCGMIRLGLDADLILLDFTSPHLMPCHNVLSHLVYSASGHDVVLTMVRGQILYSAGKYLTIDLESVVQELASYAMPRIFSKEKD